MIKRMSSQTFVKSIPEVQEEGQPKEQAKGPLGFLGGLLVLGGEVQTSDGTGEEATSFPLTAEQLPRRRDSGWGGGADRRIRTGAMQSTSRYRLVLQQV